MLKNKIRKLQKCKSKSKFVCLSPSSLAQMDPPTVSAVRGEGGVAPVPILTPPSTLEQNGDLDSADQIAPSWTPSTGEGRKTETAAAPPELRL